MARLVISGIALLLLAIACLAQDLPSKIEGYKVQRAKVIVSTNAIDPKAAADVVIRLKNPRIAKVGLLGASVEMSGEMLSLERSGEIERMTFHDIKVNGIAVDVAQIKDRSTFKNGKVREFSHVADVTVGPAGLAKGALKELTDRKNDWAVTGTMFVFGKFKRFGLTFKRVIPVRLDLTVPNPLR